eukprot:10237336-Karenia_brevis.AAC.1
MATEELSEQLRAELLLPAQFTDFDSGIRFPKWHCVFAGCLACAETKASSEMNQEKGMWQHIWNDKKH